MQEKIKQYFLSRLQTTQQSLEKVRRDIYYLGTVRLAIVAVTIVLSYIFRAQGILVAGSILFVGILLFLLALKQWNRLQKRKDYLETSVVCDKNELDAMDYRFDAFDGAPERIQAHHPFVLDLDIFGNHSLFQSINRTATADGKQCLACWFEEPEIFLDSKLIEKRQQAIKELSRKPDLLHHFLVTGRMNQGSVSDADEMDDFVDRFTNIAHYQWWRSLHFTFPVLWVILILLCIFGVILPFKLIIFYFITLIISESKIKTINRLHAQIGGKVAILNSYSQLFKAIEQESFESEYLSKIQSCYQSEEKPASKVIAELAKLAGELEQRSNLMVRLVFNPLLLWDIHKTMQIEMWMELWGGFASEWILTASEFDAYASLATFAFTHPDYVFPELTDDYFTFKGKGLGHPLMKRETCVRNDVDIEKQPYFLVVTGANMSGKSTYLRTIGVNFLLACLGAPVCAESLRLSPVNLFTSLRTSDSLNDNESYFYAELKRLKMIIDRLNRKEKLFIILDEILKGTNSVDMQKGSLALIQQFIRLHSCGIIATHDLLLGNLEAEFPDNVKNYHFDASIVDDKMTFSYRIQEGIAHDMNACFLMKKIGITL